MKLPMSSVREDPEIQLRGGLNMDRIKAMEDFVEEGGHLPPIIVVGDDNLLADGHHRLYLAYTMGQIEIDADRVPGGKAVAVAIALKMNDLATTLPLTRTERNEGVKLLLQAGWTQERIAEATGVHQKTISNITNSLAMRGLVIKRNGGRGTPKPVTVLPPEVHEKLGDTVLVRIADGVPLEQQAEFAAAVAQAELPEPRVREAIRALGSNGMTPTEAVEEFTPSGRATPVTMADVAKQARRRLERFVSEPMVVEGEERDFWGVLAVLAFHSDRIPLEARSLSRFLDDIASKASLYSAKLYKAEEIEA